MADGSLGTFYSGNMFSYADQTVTGNKYSRAGMSLPPVVDRTNTPAGFPLDMWSDQINRMSSWWRWWRGDPFNEVIEEGTDTTPPVYRYPLRINTLRQICRIHNAMLWGRTRRNDGTILQTRVLPPVSFTGEQKRDESMAGFATTAERILDFVWKQSNQSAILWEGGLLGQFLGGYYLQLMNLTGVRASVVPLGIKMVYPDFVLPIPNPDDPYELFEAYVTYRVSGAAAKQKFGPLSAKQEKAGYVIYTQHWTRETYGEYIDGQPLVNTYAGVFNTKIIEIQHERPNPFGFVPLVYIPRMRSGAFMGDPITPEIVGLMAEYNSRYGDLGDIVDQSAQNMWQGSNMASNPVWDKLADGTPFLNLGSKQPGPYSENPTFEPKRPEQLSESTLKYPQQLRTDMYRESMTSPVTFGDDPGGGQRSGETLLIRMFPTLAMADASRAFADPGIRRMEQYVLLAIARLKLKIPGVAKFEESDVSLLDITHVWNPSIPRDDDKDTNRRVTEVGGSTMSIYDAVAGRSDVEDVDREVARIWDDKERLAKMAAAAKPVTEKPTAKEEPSESETPSDGEEQQ